MTGFLADVRYALRGLVRQPTFAWTAIAAAALGIGATTAIFSVVDRILFRPLPYAYEERLVSTGMLAPLDTNEFLFAQSYLALRQTSRPFEAVTAFEAGAFEVDLNMEQPVRLKAVRLERNFFATLGVALAAGRTFSEDEDRRGGPPVAIVSAGLWRQPLGGRLPATIELDGQSVQVVGVAPADFELPTLTKADVLLPMALDPTRERAGRAFRVFARLPAGLSIERARAEIAPFATAQLETVPPRFRKEIRWAVQSVRDRQVGSSRLASHALLGAAFALLLIACANIANLLLARAVGREKEFAVRTALGASRGRLVRQMLTESLLLGLAGGVVGCGVAWAVLRMVVQLGAGAMPRLEEATLDARVLLAAAMVSLGASVLFGLAPAWRRASGPRGGLRASMVAAQMALSVVLLASAGLLLRTLWTLESTRTGMDAEQVVTARFVLSKQRFGASPQAQVDFFSELDRRLAAGPGVTAAAVTDSLPPTGGTRGRPYSTIEIEGELPAPEGSGGMVAWRYVTPGYFAALGIRVVEGRGFSTEDQARDANAILLNQTLARKMFPRGGAVGRRLLKTREGQWHTVVGVVADVRNRGLERGADPEFYIVRKPAPDGNFANAEPPLGWRSGVAIVRTSVAPALAAAFLRDTIQEFDATMPVTVETMPERMRGVTMRPRFQARLLVAFGATGLALAAIGIYGTLAYLVAQRRRELGIRLALGATRRNLVGLVLGQTGRWLAAGLVGGILLAIGAARATRNLLFGVAPSDPWALGAAAALLGVVALLAAAAPAWRAATIDPSRVLREE